MEFQLCRISTYLRTGVHEEDLCVLDALAVLGLACPRQRSRSRMKSVKNGVVMDL